MVYFRFELYCALNAHLVTHGTNIGSKLLLLLRVLAMELDEFVTLRR